MCKIPINLLLNPVSQEVPQEKLRNIKKRLVTLCSELPSDSARFEKNRKELEKILSHLDSLTRGCTFTSEDKKLISTTYQLSSILSVILREATDLSSERELILHSKSRYNISTAAALEKKRKEDFVFNVVTQDMLTNRRSSNKNYRGHRLPKQKTHALECWFNKNIDHPYLKNSSLKELITETKLSGPQIKNWVSNRRRKEKSLTISFEVSDVLKEGEKGSECLKQ